MKSPVTRKLLYKYVWTRIKNGETLDKVCCTIHTTPTNLTYNKDKVYRWNTPPPLQGSVKLLLHILLPLLLPAVTHIDRRYYITLPPSDIVQQNINYLLWKSHWPKHHGPTTPTSKRRHSTFLWTHPWVFQLPSTYYKNLVLTLPCRHWSTHIRYISYWSLNFTLG